MELKTFSAEYSINFQKNYSQKIIQAVFFCVLCNYILSDVLCTPRFIEIIIRVGKILKGFIRVTNESKPLKYNSMTLKNANLKQLIMTLLTRT